MTRLFTIALLALTIALPAAAQSLQVQRMGDPAQRNTPSTTSDEPRLLHVSDWLNHLPIAREALDDFHRRKELGLLPDADKSAQAFDVGDTLTFKVFNFDQSTQNNPVLDNIDFRKVAEGDRFDLWAELAEIDNGNVTQEKIDTSVEALGTSTPEGSIDPNEGIIVNDERLFGDPPDVDGDGKSDVLLMDIRDGFDCTTSSFIGGFVFSGDLSGTGNNRDVLYLDTCNSPLGLALTAAHEYQHLIMFEYDRNEGTFVNEGLSEWAEIANGYPGRLISYLNDSDRYNVDFLRFLDNSDPRVGDDYQRAGLFTTYIAQIIGPFETGRITRQDANDLAGYDAVLAARGLSTGDLMLDFHTANFLNDRSVDPNLGYEVEQRAGLHAVPIASFDGRIQSDTELTPITVREGAAQYVVWDQVEDFTLLIDLGTGTDGLRARTLLTRADAGKTLNNVEVRDIDPQMTEHSFSGKYDRIVLILSNIDGSRSAPPSLFTYSANWKEAEQTVSLLNVQYDNGQFGTQGEDNPFFLLVDSSNPAAATRFVVPSADQGTSVDKVLLAPLFLSHFTNGGQPPEAPRDLTLKIWGLSASGRPGDELFSLEITDPRTLGLTTTIDFFEVDLASFAAELSSLPDSIFVGYTNAGSDENSFIFAVSPYDVEEVSFVTSNVDAGWGGLWGVGPPGGEERPYEGTVIPIRVQFAIPTATAINDDTDEVPSKIVLHPNFPNPFNPTTTIGFALPQTADVTLKVYDLLGRQIAVLVDGVHAPGTHQVQVDASAWASGTYFYILQTPETRLTQRMVLIK